MNAGPGPALPDGPVQAAMRRLWVVYDAAHVELTRRLRDRLATHPYFGALVRDTPEDPAEAARQHERVRAAMEDGAWEPYWASIRSQATVYAHAEIPFAAWVELIQMFRGSLLERLFAVGTEDLEADVGALNRWLDDALAVFGQAFVDANEEVIARQQQAIRQLSTPILPVRPGLLLLPIVGSLDADRLRQLRVGMLESIRSRRARVVVLDVTGVPQLDMVVTAQLIDTIASARLMGAEVIISGLSAETAQALAIPGVDLTAVVAASDLESGMERAEALLDPR